MAIKKEQCLPGLLIEIQDKIPKYRYTFSTENDVPGVVASSETEDNVLIKPGEVVKLLGLPKKTRDSGNVIKFEYKGVEHQTFWYQIRAQKIVQTEEKE